MQGCLAVAGNGATGVVDALVPAWLGERFRLNILWQGVVFSCASASYLLSTPLAGWTSDHYPKWKCLCAGVFTTALGLGGFFVAQSLSVVCVALLLVGAGIGFIDTPVLPLLANILAASYVTPALLPDSQFYVRQVGQEPEAAMGLIYTLNDMFLCVGFAVGPVLGSVVQAGFGNG